MRPRGRPVEDVRRVLETRRRIELVVGVTEPELAERSSRPLVLGMVARKERRRVQRLERVRDDGARGFGREAFPQCSERM